MIDDEYKQFEREYLSLEPEERASERGRSSRLEQICLKWRRDRDSATGLVRLSSQARLPAGRPATLLPAFESIFNNRYELRAHSASAGRSQESWLPACRQAGASFLAERAILNEEEKLAASFSGGETGIRPPVSPAARRRPPLDAYPLLQRVPKRLRVSNLNNSYVEK